MTTALSPYDRPLFDGKPWKDGLVYYGCDEDGIVIHPPLLTEVCSDQGNLCWLPKAWYPERNKARLAVTKWGRAEISIAWDYIDVRCRTEWLQLRDEYEEGRLINAFEGEPGCTYWACKPEDEHAMEFWRLEAKQ